MGQVNYSAPTTERTVTDKFVTWLKGIEFRDDSELIQALTDIRKACLDFVDAEDRDGKS